MKITSWNIKNASRHGLTLMEILASVFVLAFGLLAVLTILPFGAFQLERMKVADMSGACGRGAIQQVRMAEWQKPELLDFNGGTSYIPADPYIVDPLGNIAGGRGGPKNFPLAATLNERLYAFNLAEIIAQGTTLNAQHNLPEDQVMADRHFRWNDDTVFTASDDSSRPTLIQKEKPDGSIEYIQQVAGNFTWLYMVTPIIDMQADVLRSAISTIASTNAENINGYEVAAVVFYKRDLYPDPDPAAYKPIRRLLLTSPTINSTGAYIELRSANEDDLDLSSIKWILLTGQSQELVESIARSDNPLVGSLVAQWYRVTGSDDIQSDGSGGYLRRVFLVGPDWKGAKLSNGDPDGDVYAILCDGVVNVFQASMPK